MSAIQEVGDGIFLIDVWQFGRPNAGGVYLILGDPVALLESGTSISAPKILSALAELGVAREGVGWIFLTHVHLDHAGGAGALLPKLQNAMVVVHERGAKHLVDPSRLVASVKEAVGERFPFYGTAVPIPEECLFVAHDGDQFDLGRFAVRAIDTPGHAPHHLCFLEERTGVLFTGDAAGLHLNGSLLPATPPPSFNLAASRTSLEKLRTFAPNLLLYTHFGPGPADLILQYEKLLAAWVEAVRMALAQAHGDEAAAINQLLGGFGHALSHSPEGRPAADPLVREELAMSARGVIAYLQREGKAT
jgi:glyoxylase-like metal-dependent hydrolase (beta-lactamase superfamily II)